MGSGRQTETKRERQTERWIERETETHRERETGSEREAETDRQRGEGGRQKESEREVGLGQEAFICLPGDLDVVNEEIKGF